MEACPSCGHENPEGAKFCMECAAPLACAGALGGGGAEGRHLAVLRSGRVHGVVGVGRSGGRRSDAGGVLRRWRGRRSRRTAGWWRSSSATRWSACSACRRRTRTTRSGRCGRGFGSSRTRSGWTAVGGAPLAAAGRDQHRGGARAAGCRPRARASGSWPGMRSTRPRGSQSVAPEMGVAVGLATYEATAAGVRLRGAGAGDAEGEGRAGAGVPREGAAGRFGIDLTRTHDSPFVGREIDLALAEGSLRQDRRGELGAAGDGGRRAGAGQEPDRGRAVRAMSMRGRSS